MPTNRVTGNSANGIVVLRIPRDKEYDLVQIAERFEVPYYEPKTPQQAQMYMAMIEGTMRAVVKRAVWRYENLRHWKWESSRPVTLDVSAAQFDLDEFSSSRFDADFHAQDQGSLIQNRGRKAYVAKMWFIQPKIEVEVITPEKDDPETSDGFVNPYQMPNFVNLESK